MTQSNPEHKFANETLFTDEELRPQSLSDVLAQEHFANKLQQCQERFGKPFAEMELAFQNAVVFRRLQQIVNSLLVNPCWRQRLEKFGVSSAPENSEQWQQLPITDRETLNAFYMGKRAGQVVPLSQGGFQVIASGGTSGGLPIETVYSLEELHNTYKLSGQFLGHYVLPSFLKGDQEKWIITTLSDYEMWSSGSMIGGLLQQTPGVNFIAAGPMGEKVYDHIMSFDGPKAIMGMSREIEGLIPLGQHLSLQQRESFQLAIYGSGIIQARKLEDLKALYPNLQIISYFASNQAEAIGIELTPNSVLTAVPGLHFIEIVDDKGRWVEVGEEGELVITRLHAKEAPILRMQLGDRMIRQPDRQEAGLNSHQFTFAGRSSDILHLGESHYSCPRTYQALCELFLKEKIMDLQQEVHELQFVNYRKEKRLQLLLSMQQAEQQNQQLKALLNADQTRQFFIQALKASLSLFDQTEAQFKALEATQYRFEINIVAKESSQFYKTRVNKIPLIRDIL